MTELEKGHAELFPAMKGERISIANSERIEALERRIDELERTVAAMQVLFGKAAEYKARPRPRRRLPG